MVRKTNKKRKHLIEIKEELFRYVNNFAIKFLDTVITESYNLVLCQSSDMFIFPAPAHISVAPTDWYLFQMSYNNYAALNQMHQRTEAAPL